MFEMKTLLPFESLNRSVLVKKVSKTSPRFGFNPEERKIKELLDFGVINIDKPKGPTSHQTSAYVQKVLSIKK